MALEEFKFPHETEAAEKEEAVEFEIEGAEAPEIEVVDDTPEQDRGRKPMQEPPKDVTDDDLSKYDDSVRKRIQHFTKGYHDERRAKEAALREREEALRYASTILEENNRLKGAIGKNQQSLVAQAKKLAETELAEAKRKYREAYEAGDAEAVVAAQAELTKATVTVDKIANYRPAPVQEPENDVKTQQQVRAPEPEPQPAVRPDPKAEAWQAQNRWFGQDEEMTSFALGLHTKMVNEGVDPTSDAYYDRLNARLRQVFPDAFESEKSADAPNSQRTKSNVAPATRSTAPRKIVLTQSQVNIAKRLGVSLEAYAREVAQQMRK